jgi:hypothetical protein
MPSSRVTSSSARPASTCFSAAIISGSLCLFLIIRVPIRLKSHTISNGCSFNLKGEGQGYGTEAASARARREYRGRNGDPTVGERQWGSALLCFRGLVVFDFAGACSTLRGGFQLRTVGLHPLFASKRPEKSKKKAARPVQAV